MADVDAPLIAYRLPLIAGLGLELGMAIRDLLVNELNMEAKRTRAALGRVPADKAEWKPSPKSTALGKLSAHVAQLGGFAVPILTQPELDFATAGMKPLAFESVAQLLQAFDGGLAATQQALGKIDDGAWSDNWKLRMGENVFFDDNRFNAYRAMFANHLVHHRAQLGVYFRLLGVAVPATYGPSADEF